ncbi:MAG: glycosyltransferase family 39 protein [Chloroflexi bacterium]|nr:glycosyltransferase family 39 protein [Chloroflexota bacterium]
MQKVVTWFLILSADIILVLELSSLNDLLNKPTFLLLIQGIITGVSYIVNYYFQIGYTSWANLQIKQKIQNLSFLINKNRWLTVFALIVGLNYALLAVCILVFPQNITDSLYNHLARIGYWIQQGSLKPYEGFAIVGTVYPYNNSILMTLSVVFLKSDSLVGFTQYFSALICALCIYSLSLQIGFKRKSALIAALIFLTFPLVLYESITAQNDLVVTAFAASAVTLLVQYVFSNDRRYLILSALGLALAIGTKQYIVFLLPGYAALLIYGLYKDKLNWKSKFAIWFCSATIFTILAGSYTYIQNLITYQTPFGPKGTLEEVTEFSSIGNIFPRVVTNSSRLADQFISCDGLPPMMAESCLGIKEKILKPISAKSIESDLYIYGTSQYNLSTPNVYNAESAWYGPLSWILIIPSILYGLYYAIIKRKPVNLILLVTSLLFFFSMPIAKYGWDAYQGRYLLVSVVLFQPFVARIFESQKLFPKLVTSLICLANLLLMVYSTFNNASLPLSSKSTFIQIEKWGKEHNVLVQKISYKLKPFAMYEKDVWTMNRLEIMTIGNRIFYYPVQLVEKYVPLNGTLGLASNFNDYPDYLLRGKQVSRILVPIKNLDKINSYKDTEYLLLSPEYESADFAHYSELERFNHWVLLQKNGE